MADLTRTQADLLLSFADNNTRAILPQNFRDHIMTSVPARAHIVDINKQSISGNSSRSFMSMTFPAAQSGYAFLSISGMVAVVGDPTTSRHIASRWFDLKGCRSLTQDGTYSISTDLTVSDQAATSASIKSLDSITVTYVATSVSSTLYLHNSISGSGITNASLSITARAVMIYNGFTNIVTITAV